MLVKPEEIWLKFQEQWDCRIALRSSQSLSVVEFIFWTPLWFKKNSQNYLSFSSNPDQFNTVHKLCSSCSWKSPDYLPVNFNYSRVQCKNKFLPWESHYENHFSYPQRMNQSASPLLRKNKHVAIESSTVPICAVPSLTSPPPTA